MHNDADIQEKKTQILSQNTGQPMYQSTSGSLSRRWGKSQQYYNV